jgi:hypothetical protein
VSIVELKEHVAGLSRKHRFQLSAFLADLEGETEGEFQATANRRMRSMDAGRKVTAREFEQLHKRSRTKGR